MGRSQQKPLVHLKKHEAAKFIENWVRPYCPDPRVIFDVGGLNGNQSIEFALAYPKARVFCFEAHPDHAKVCAFNTKAHPQITVVHGAAGNVHGGELTFWKSVGNNPGGSSLYRFTDKMVAAKKFKQMPIKVPAIAIGEWAKTAGVDRCDVLWADIQGHEGPMLAGMGELLNTLQVAHLESHLEPAYIGQSMDVDIDRLLTTAGMTRTHWYPHRSVVKCGDVVYRRFTD